MGYSPLDLAVLEAHLDPSLLSHPTDREKEGEYSTYYLSSGLLSAIYGDVYMEAYSLAHLLVLLVPPPPVHHVLPTINQATQIQSVSR